MWLVDNKDDSKVTSDSEEKAVESLKNMRRCMKGLYDIINISLPDDDVYSKLALDNLIILHHNLLDLIKDEKGIKLINKKIRNSEIKIDSSINFFLDE